MTHEKILRHLDSIGQTQLSVGLDLLTQDELELFWAKIERLSPFLLQKQRRALAQREKKWNSLEPFNHYHLAGSASDKHCGEQLLSDGKVGCLILAGGQGTRLGIAGSKGMVPVSLVKNKSLFQLFFEKTLAASKKAGRPLPLAIMTSPLHFSPILDYFEQAHWFGLGKSQIDLFAQDMLPFMEDSGNWMLQAPGKIAEGPDGNGNFFKAFCRAGIGKKWKEAGIQCINVILVDNPLADPFDAELCGHHSRMGAEATVKSVLKSDPFENVGTIISDKGRPRVVEYSEFPREDLPASNADGSLRFPLANTSLFCFDIDFVNRTGSDPDLSLPWHPVRKKAEVLTHHPQVSSQMIWKCETFIFDLLEYAEKIEVVVYPREKCFAPLKNLSGESSFETVRSALLASDKAAYFHVTGVSAPDKKFELDQRFYYPTQQLIEKWKGMPLPESEYIEAERNPEFR
jgi:UDP-N-acetylglucosamine/UDP-N-acetylgalactosamine diphosphorylase